jgi:hypothetical protein
MKVVASSTRKVCMSVLLVPHTCQSRTECQPHAQCLGRIPDVELGLLTPDRWLHYRKWRLPEATVAPSFAFQVGKVAWPWVGPAQFYLHWCLELSKTLKEFQSGIIDLWKRTGAW